MEFVPVNLAVGFQTLVRPRYHGRTSLPPSIPPVLETSPALHCRIPRPESQLCNPSAMRAAPKALTRLIRHGLWSLPPSIFLLPECSPGTSLKTTPRSHALTRNSWAGLPEIPHDQLTASAGVCLCPSPSPRNHFPGPLPQKPRPARRTPQSIICGAGAQKPNETESSWARESSLAQPLSSKIGARAPFFVYHAPYSCAAPRKSWGRSLPSSIFLPHGPCPRFSFLFAAPHVYIAAPKSWSGFPKPPLSPGFATAGVFPP